MPIENATKRRNRTNFRRQNSDTNIAPGLGLRAPGVHAGRRCNVLRAECCLAKAFGKAQVASGPITKSDMNLDFDFDFVFYPARICLVGIGG